MNVLSLFDGISCGQIALQRSKIKIDNYYASEIKGEAMAVTQYNFPNTKQIGDVKKITKEYLPKIDLLIGGSPCQSFSRAGNGEGFDGKSGLFWEYVRILKEFKPKYFLLENVKMKREWQDIITEALGVDPININSKLVSAQLRNRFYWTNIPGVEQPKDKKIFLQDILESGFTDREKSRAILESESRPLKNPAKMLRRYIQTGFTTLIYEDNKTLLKVRNATKKGYVLVKDNEGVDLSFPTSKTRRGRLMADKLHTITATPNEYFLFKEGELRYFTRTELEKCQTLPVGYTKILSRNKAAGCIGDGWTVDVIAHILKNIKTI